MLERSFSRADVVHDQAVGVDIDLLIVLFVPYDFWRHVQVASNAARHRVPFGINGGHHLADPEVGDLKLQVLREEQVERLEISVHNGHLSFVAQMISPKKLSLSDYDSSKRYYYPQKKRDMH